MMTTFDGEASAESLGEEWRAGSQFTLGTRPVDYRRMLIPPLEPLVQ